MYETFWSAKAKFHVGLNVVLTNVDMTCNKIVTKNNYLVLNHTSLVGCKMFAKLVKYGYQGVTKNICSFVLQIQIFHNNMPHAQCLSFLASWLGDMKIALFFPPFLHSSDPHKWNYVYKNFVVQYLMEFM